MPCSRPRERQLSFIRCARCSRAFHKGGDAPTAVRATAALWGWRWYRGQFLCPDCFTAAFHERSLASDQRR
jgi:hypothetical protein